MKINFHPITRVMAFSSIIVTPLLISHPVLIVIYFVSAISIYKDHISKQSIFGYLFLILIITITNPIFVLRGTTILFNLFNRAYTLEALYYGFIFSLMIVGTVIWFQIINQFITSEHIIYLFSKPFANIAVLVAMTINLIPRIKQRYQEITELGVESNKFIQLMTLFTWTFENSVDKVDSMSARGYSNRRTNFHLFKFKQYDGLLVILIIFIMLFQVYFYINHYSYYFYPIIKQVEFDLFHIIAYTFYLVSTLIPLFMKGE